MGFVASFVLPGGSTGVKYFSSREEMEAWKRAHPTGKLLNVREKKPRDIKDIPSNIPSPDVVLREKYGVGLEEIQQIINSSKSQPEAIQKLRRMLTGSTKYDPRYRELEVILTQAWDAKTHPDIPEAKEQYEDALKSLVVRNTGIKTVPKPEPKPTIVATRVPTNAEPHTVHVTNIQEQEPKKTDLKKVGLGLLGLAVLYYMLRRR